MAENALDDGGADGVGAGNIHGLELLPERGVGGGVAAAEADDVVAEAQRLRQHHRHPCKWIKKSMSAIINTSTAAELKKQNSAENPGAATISKRAGPLPKAGEWAFGGQ